jgi:SIR2-like protein
MNDTQEQQWSTLIHKIRAELCTPILGAGAAQHLLPLAKDLAEKLLQHQEGKNGKSPLRDRGDLAQVSQYIAVQCEDNFVPKIMIADHLRAHLAAPPKPKAAAATGIAEDPSSEPHRALAALRLPIYLTTNYDNLMYRALEDLGARPVREFARWNSPLLEKFTSRFDSGYEPSSAEPLVFHIHGHWDAPESMIATEDDYLDFIVNISRDLATSPRDASKKVMLPTRVRRALTGTTLLFIGYSLADINFRIILRGLLGPLEPSARHKSVSVQYCNGQPGELEKYIEEYFGYTLSLNVFWCSAHEFCRKLNAKMALVRSASAG